MKKFNKKMVDEKEERIRKKLDRLVAERERLITKLDMVEKEILVLGKLLLKMIKQKKYVNPFENVADFLKLAKKTNRTIGKKQKLKNKT